MFVLFCIFIFVCFPVSRFVNAGKVMTGQPHPVSVNNNKVLSAARFAVDEFNRVNTQDQFVYKIVNITSAEIQVVAGLNYILDVQLAPATCKKSGEPCDFLSASKELWCNFIVTEIPWEDSRALTGEKCHHQSD